MGMFRDVVGTAVPGFLVVVLVRRGASLALAGVSLTVYSLAGAAGFRSVWPQRNPRGGHVLVVTAAGALADWVGLELAAVPVD